MSDKQRFEPKKIAIKGARLAFARIHKAESRKGKDGKPQGEPKFSCTLLLDPSNKDHAATIQEIKLEAKRALDFRFGEGGWSPTMPNFYLPFGLGNDLPKQGKKLSDGFANMFYLKLSDKNRPNLLNRSGTAVVEGDKQCPYAGCYVAGVTTLYTYDNNSKGVGANLRTLVFMKDGEAFGGGQANAAEEYEALGLGEGAEPFVEESGADPFNIG